MGELLTKYPSDNIKKTQERQIALKESFWQENIMVPSMQIFQSTAPNAWSKS